jgi:hypothetical protein
LIGAIGLVSACNSNKPSQQLTKKEKEHFLQMGDSITTIAQNTLLMNVSKAVQNGGTDYAVGFCNTRALPLTDSIASKYNVSIKRLSDKYRNPSNSIESVEDQKAWKKIQASDAAFIEYHPDDCIQYYKPIKIGMTTCIKCHGDKSNISESTQKIISQKYPLDKAVGYKIGDLRGMWKIKITTK